LGYEQKTRWGVGLGAETETYFREDGTKNQELNFKVEAIDVLPLMLSELYHIFMKGDIFWDKILMSERIKTYITTQTSNFL